MVCQACQRNIADGSRFCYNCGAKQPEPAYAYNPNVASQTGGAKRLMRSRTDRKLGGVAAGLAEYFDLDPTLVRLLWVLLFFFGGTGLLAYVILWIVLPEEPPYVPVAEPPITPPPPPVASSPVAS